MNEHPPKPRHPNLGLESPTFDTLPLHPTLKQGIREMGYLTPTPVQAGTIPLAVEGHDVIGVAQTGTGKTAAFLLPILERLLDRPRGRLHALVLTPTRELALQADGFVRELGRHTPLRAACVYGGVGMGDQERALRGGAEIIVATPGRLLDHMSRGYVDFRGLSILVLDEADRMLDMGFLPDVRRILSRLPSHRQTLLFSATMPPEIVRLSREFLRHPREVRIDASTVAAAGITHRAMEVAPDLKTSALLTLLRDPSMSSVLVFVRTKHRADRLARQLSREGVPAAVIHGDRSQSQRVHALEGFRGGRHRILVATDIAARGVDVEGVSHVINYDLPNEVEVYVHRVGRTARAQREGDAVSLYSREERDALHRIERHLGLTVERMATPDLPRLPPLVQVHPPASHHPRPHSSSRERGGRTGRPRGPYRPQRRYRPRRN